MAAALIMLGAGGGAFTLTAGICRRIHDRVLFYGHSHREPATILSDDLWIASGKGASSSSSSSSSSASSALLHARILPATRKEKRHHVILFCHGNAGNLDNWTAAVQSLREFGDVCIFDYRGYGSSTGSPSAAGILEDGEAVLREAVFRSYSEAPKSRHRYREISVYGQSIGAVVAAHIANHPRITRLILETPLVDIKDIAPSVCAFAYRAGILPNIEILPKLLRVNAAQTKTHIVLATKDEVVPFHSSSLGLLRKYAFQDILRVECGHNDVKESVAYQAWIRNVFVASL